MSIWKQLVNTTLEITKIEGENRFVNTDSYTKKWIFGILYYYHQGYEYQVDHREVKEKGTGFLKK